MKKNKEKITVAIYVRKSREEEGGKEETLHNQRETLIRLAKSKGYDYELFQEVDSSIKWNRPELAKMLEGILAGHFSRVLVTHTDRLSRDERDSAELKEIFIENEILIETPDNLIDLSDENQELIFGFTSVLSAFEYKRIRQRLAKGKYDAVAIKNRWMGSISPIGYTWDKNTKKLLVCEDEKKIIREMVSLALGGYSSSQIANKINALGYRTRKGNPFRPDSILRILKNRVYTGESSFNSVRLKKFAVAKNTHEPLISETEFNQIQNFFISRRVKEHLNSLGVKSSVNKLVVCGICGKTCSIMKSSNRRVSGQLYEFYMLRPCRHKIDLEPPCPNKGIKIEKIEKAVHQALLRYKQELEKTLISLFAEDTKEMEVELEGKIKNIEAEKAKQQRKKQRLLDLYLDEGIDKESYHKSMEQIDQTLTNLNKEYEIASHKLDTLNATTQAEIIEEVLTIIESFEEMALEEQNATLKLLIDKIEYVRTAETNNKPMINIHWREL